MTFQDLFGQKKPLIGVLHLLPLPGAPLYDGHIQKVYDQALAELEIFKHHAIDSIIIENFARHAGRSGPRADGNCRRARRGVARNRPCCRDAGRRQRPAQRR